MERLSIGEMSKLSCVSIKALRHYHRKGVFSPACVDEAIADGVVLNRPGRDTIFKMCLPVRSANDAP